MSGEPGGLAAVLHLRPIWVTDKCLDPKILPWVTTKQAQREVHHNTCLHSSYTLCRTIVTYKLTNWPKHKTNLHIFTCLFSDNSLCLCDTELTLKAWKNIQEQSWNYWEQSRRCHIYYIVQSSTEFMWWKTREVTYKKGRVLLFLFTKITADKIHISRALDTRQT